MKLLRMCKVKKSVKNVDFSLWVIVRPFVSLWTTGSMKLGILDYNSMREMDCVQDEPITKSYFYCTFPFFLEQCEWGCGWWLEGRWQWRWRTKIHLEKCYQKRRHQKVYFGWRKNGFRYNNTSLKIVMENHVKNCM